LLSNGWLLELAMTAVGRDPASAKVRNAGNWELLAGDRVRPAAVIRQRRVLDIDLEHYPKCGGEFKIITAMEESDLLENYENFDGETRAAWQQAMLLSIPGIAAAMRSTG
jgi:hypothetical protein